MAHLDASERSEWSSAFKQQLNDLGYVEGSNVTFETRSAKGALEQLRPMAQELVRVKVDVIVTSGTSAAMAAKRATTRIPIVMATGTDQVSLSLPASLAHPGGISRLAVLWHAENVSSRASVRDIEIAAGKSSVSMQPVGISSADELIRRGCKGECRHGCHESGAARRESTTSAVQGTEFHERVAEGDGGRAIWKDSLSRYLQRPHPGRDSSMGCI